MEINGWKLIYESKSMIRYKNDALAYAKKLSGED